MLRSRPLLLRKLDVNVVEISRMINNCERVLVSRIELATEVTAIQFLKLGNIIRLSELTSLSARRADRQWGTLPSEKLICPATAVHSHGKHGDINDD
jgi:hypothetical protein